MTLESVAGALKARKVGFTWMACCPAHEDRNPSLAIREKDGKVLLHCHAGCSQEAVIEALKQLGIWEPDHSPSHKRSIVATYQYTDAQGELLYEIVRWDTAPKTFSQRRPDGHGGWIWKKHPNQVLYHLPELLGAPIVFVVEGEKDVETMRSHGFVATTAAGGAKAPWLPQYTEALLGREVILVPDRDNEGRLRVVRIGRALLGKVPRLVILELEDGKDVSEWFARGHSELELIEQLEGNQVSK